MFLSVGPAASHCPLQKFYPGPDLFSQFNFFYLKNLFILVINLYNLIFNTSLC